MYKPLWQKCIEDIGGYDEAKRQVEEDLQNYPLVLFNVGAMQSHLLEHRRQHNIYEIGDKVVEKADSQFGILEITAISESSATACNDVLHSTYGLSECSLSYYVRHATDEEIAAGKRL